MPARGQGEEVEDADERTPAQKAAEQVTTMIRRAWERAQNVHGLIKHVIDHVDAPDQDWVAILQWSGILGLQAHTRPPSRGKFTQMNYVDLLQAESITKTLGRMVETPLTAVMDEELGSQGEYENAMLTHLIGQFADDRWLTAARLREMIPALARAPREAPGPGV